MGYVRKLGNQFRIFFLPDNMGGFNPLAGRIACERVDLVAVERSPDLKTVKAVGLGVKIQQPGASVVNVAKIAVTADHRTSAVAYSGIVMQIQSAERKTALGKRPDKVNRNKTTAEPHHFGPVNCGLQPGAVVESSVPVINWRMVTAERDFQMIVFFEADNAAFQLYVE